MYYDVFFFIYYFFFFKQKTAYEMRISDWSSDVCSSDLMREFLCASRRGLSGRRLAAGGHQGGQAAVVVIVLQAARGGGRLGLQVVAALEIGRASCRERVCQYV